MDVAASPCLKTVSFGATTWRSRCSMSLSFIVWFRMENMGMSAA